MQNNNNLLIKDRSTFVKLSVDEVVWIQSDGNYITINTEFKKFVVKQSLKSVVNILNDERLVKIHKSYVVRADLIDYIDTQSDTVFVRGERLPVGRSFKENLFDKYIVLK